MIRNDNQFQRVAHRLLDQTNNLYDRGMRADDMADVRQYRWLQSLDVAKRCVPTWQMDSGWLHYAYTLFMLRTITDSTQHDLARVLGKTQAAIARMESPRSNVRQDAEVGDAAESDTAGCLDSAQPAPLRGENLELDSLHHWGEACGYEPVTLFMRNGGYNDPDGLARLTLDAAAIRLFFGSKTRGAIADAIRVLLERLKFVTEADSLTCYMVDGSSNGLVLFHYSGVLNEQFMQGQVNNANAPLLLINAKTAGFFKASDAPFRNSGFTEREKVKCVLHIPLKPTERKRRNSGIVFLSYRRPVEEPTAEYLQELRVLSELLVFVMGGQRLRVSELQESSSQWWHTADHAPYVSPKSILACPQAQHAIGDVLLADAPDWDKAIAALLNASTSDALRGARHALFLQDDSSRRLRLIGSKKSGTRHWSQNRIYKDLAKCVVSSSSYGISDDRKALAVPVFGGPRQRAVGALVAHSPNAELRPQDSKMLEVIGQIITVAYGTEELRETARSPLKLEEQLRAYVPEILSALDPDRGGGRRQRYNSVDAAVRLAADIFGGIVDFWSYDRDEATVPGNFCSHAAAEGVCTDKVDPAKLRARKLGNTIKLLFETDEDVLPIWNAQDDPSVSAYTKKLGVRALLGVRIHGPWSVYPEGVMWIRFTRPIAPGERSKLLKNARFVAGLIHLIWEASDQVNSAWDEKCAKEQSPDGVPLEQD